MGLDSLLEVAASALPDRIAVGSRRDGISFAGLQERTRGGATVLRETGGRHVAYLGVNAPAFTCALFAASVAGMAITPLNYRLPDEQLNELLDELDQPIVLVDEEQAARGSVGGAITITTSEWMRRSAMAEPAQPVLAADDSIAVLLFTSGTTSRPKGVVLRHHHLTAYLLQTVELLSADEADCALITVPPYHVAGVASALSNVCAGRRVVHLSNFTASGWLDLALRERVTHAMVVPTMLQRIVEHLGQTGADVPPLKTLAYGGARISPIVLERALQLFPTTDFVNAYGLTETSSTITLLGPTDHRAVLGSDDPAVRGRLASAGRAVPGVELQVRDEAGGIMPPGQAGQLWVRGEQISGEYSGSGAVLDPDGWFCTRDRATLDAEGYLYIEGRSDDTIIRAGENIAPAEIEDVLLGYPGVRDAAVVGLPDEEWGERIAAVVVAASGETISVDDVREYAHRHLRSARTPDEIEVWPELPYNATGKLLRREIVTAIQARQGAGTRHG